MKWRLVAVKLVRSFRQNGLRTTVRFAAAHLKPQRIETTDGFDAARGTDTSGTVPLWKLRLNSSNAQFGTGYQTSSGRGLVEAIKVIGEHPRNLTFIDLGCGKGRMCILARELGFKKVVGVEFAPELARIAEENLKTTGATDAAVIVADAANFNFPPEAFLLYLFNPFGPEVMEKVVENLRLAKAERQFIVYDSARCADLFDSCGFLRRIGSQSPDAPIVWSRPSPAAG